MLGKIFGIICAVSFVFSIVMGNVDALAAAVLDGAADAVQITISLIGIMSLWCGVMRILEAAGAVRAFSKLISPLLRVFFPRAYKSQKGASEISASIAANLLGIGNAATPLALRAMERMQEDNPDKEKATDDMITLATLNSAGFSLMPTTIIALRRASLSNALFSIIVPVWICSFLCSLLSLVLSRAFSLGGDRK